MSLTRSPLRGAGIFLVCVVWTATAIAREADGRLGLIHAPHNGAPVVITPGGAFEAVLEEEARLKLVDSERTVALAVEWSTAHDGRWLAECHTPSDIPPGAYALEADAGGDAIQNVRAVYVREDLPGAYVAAHIADPLIANEDGAAAERLARAVDAVNASPADLLLVSGKLTEDDSSEQFKTLFELLDAAETPTVVCPATGGTKAGYFHDDVFVFRFGRDAYLVYDEAPLLDAHHPDRLGARLYRYRREIKPARWSIGVTGHYFQPQSMRAQIALFIDDPLDMLLAAKRADPEENLEYAFPWGGVSALLTPPLETEALRFIEISQAELSPGPVEEIPSAGDEDVQEPDAG